MAADACDICYSIVVPVFNEEAVLPVLLRAGHTRRLLEDAGLRRIDTRYFVLLPCATPLCFMRRIERGLRNLSFGAQYVARGVA